MSAARAVRTALLAGMLAGVGLGGCSQDTTEVRATFTDVGDLRTRHAVQVADVRVGAITRIVLTRDFQARVTMRLNEGVRVPKRSRAVLRTTSLLGEKFIELRPDGDPATGPFLTDGDVLAQSEEAPELEFIAEQAVTVLGSVSGADLATIIRSGAESFGGRQVELASLIQDLATISGTLSSRTGDITRIIDNLDEATATLATGGPAISELLANLATTSQVLADNRQLAVTALDALARLARSSNVTLDRYRGDISRQVQQLDAIAAVVAKQSGEVGNLLDWINRFVLALPAIIPGDFTQVYGWIIPVGQDPRVEKP